MFHQQFLISLMLSRIRVELLVEADDCRFEGSDAIEEFELGCFVGFFEELGLFFVGCEQGF